MTCNKYGMGNTKQMQPIENNFVHPGSVVREIWGKGDTILLIFAGAAGEFALNKAVDWLYFTGKLPADPLGRLFSTVAYAREIIFSSTQDAHKAIDKMNHIHAAVESARGAKIPPAAYRDVLFMLIHYSIAAYEVLEQKMTMTEKNEVIEVFSRVGRRMHIEDLPATYSEWLNMHTRHQQQNLVRSVFTDDLFKQYRKHLGIVRYFILKEAQKLVMPHHVRQLLQTGKPLIITPFISLYQASKRIRLDAVLKFFLLPPLYKHRIRMLDVQPGASL